MRMLSLGRSSILNLADRGELTRLHFGRATAAIWGGADAAHRVLREKIRESHASAAASALGQAPLNDAAAGLRRSTVRYASMGRDPQEPES